MTSKQRSAKITRWLSDYLRKSGAGGFIVGISGGVDSAVTSVLCAQTGALVYCFHLPTSQVANSCETERAVEHLTWLESKFPNVVIEVIPIDELVETYHSFLLMSVFIPCKLLKPEKDLVLANAKSRLRMSALYSLANALDCLVVGIGNKVEDHGVGFFTKYGDGGVDLSPIGGCTKSDVYSLAKHLEILESIQVAAPTDGLFADGRTDESQLGATYPELEWAMGETPSPPVGTTKARQREIQKVYKTLHARNRHKMSVPPVCYF